MAAVTTMKCSARRTALQQVQSLVNELIRINDGADRVRVNLLNAGQSAADVEITVNAILAGAGPSANDTTESNGNKIIDRLINTLNVNTTDTVGQIGWLYLAE